MNTNFNEYIQAFEKTLKTVFYERANVNQFSSNRSFPPLVLREIMAKNPLSVSIPKEFGGRGAKVKECLSVLSSAAYESLPLALTLGINIALFLEPVAKYANKTVQKGIFKRFLEQQQMGGLMITEPNFGSDALNMQTSHTINNEHAHIKGTKHWQGLTGMADFWLLSSREKSKTGKLARDIDFFICDVTQKHQQIEVEEYFDNLGLYQIPYGRNKIDVQIPQQYQLQAESSGLKMMLDILHRSRMQFPGMGLGFIKRMMDEAMEHCKSRIVGGKSLFSLDQVQHQISKMQSAFTLCSALCIRSSEKSGIENDLSADGIEANSIKTVVTDLMQESAQHLVQLSGAKGYRLSHIGGRAIVDSRPFQIFEGANEMLYTQISEMFLKLMKKKKENNLFQFLSDFELSSKAADFFKKEIDFSIDLNLPQRKIVDLGKAFSRIVTADSLFNLEEKGFRKDLIQNSLLSFQQDISNLVNSFSNNKQVNSIEDYQVGSSWLKLV